MAKDCTLERSFYDPWLYILETFFSKQMCDTRYIATSAMNVLKEGDIFWILNNYTAM